MTKDRILSVSLLVVATILYIETFTFPEKSGLQMFSSAFYPRILLSIFGVISIILFVRSFLPQKNNNDQKKEKVTLRKFWMEYGKIIVLFLLTGAYVFSLEKIGFLITTIVFMLCSQAVLMGWKNRKNLILNVTVSFVSTFLVYGVFNYVLKIMLP
jgi:putative tricarboxylic transport membrane protein